MKTSSNQSKGVAFYFSSDYTVKLTIVYFIIYVSTTMNNNNLFLFISVVLPRNVQVVTLMLVICNVWLGSGKQPLVDYLLYYVVAKIIRVCYVQLFMIFTIY